MPDGGETAPPDEREGYVMLIAPFATNGVPRGPVRLFFFHPRVAQHDSFAARAAEATRPTAWRRVRPTKSARVAGYMYPDAADEKRTAFRREEKRYQLRRDQTFLTRRNRRVGGPLVTRRTCVADALDSRDLRFVAEAGGGEHGVRAVALADADRADRESHAGADPNRRAPREAYALACRPGFFIFPGALDVEKPLASPGTPGALLRRLSSALSPLSRSSSGAKLSGRSSAATPSARAVR